MTSLLLSSQLPLRDACLAPRSPGSGAESQISIPSQCLPEKGPEEPFVHISNCAPEVFSGQAHRSSHSCKSSQYQLCIQSNRVRWSPGPPPLAHGDSLITEPLPASPLPPSPSSAISAHPSSPSSSGALAETVREFIRFIQFRLNRPGTPISPSGS